MIPFILISVSCCSATATPLGTVNAWLNATDAKNAQTVVSYETTEAFSDVTPIDRFEFLEAQYENIKSTSTTNRKLVLNSETETIAMVTATFTISTTYIDTYRDGNTYVNDDLPIFLTLTKVDDRWLILQYEW